MKRTSKGSSAGTEFIRECISAGISTQLDDFQNVLRKICRVSQQDVASVKEGMSEDDGPCVGCVADAAHGAIRRAIGEWLKTSNGRCSGQN